MAAVEGFNTVFIITLSTEVKENGVLICDNDASTSIVFAARNVHRDIRHGHMEEPAAQRPARGLDAMPRHRLLPDGVLPDDLLFPAQVLRPLGHRADTVLADRRGPGQFHREPVLHFDTLGLCSGC